MYRSKQHSKPENETNGRIPVTSPIKNHIQSNPCWGQDEESYPHCLTGRVFQHVKTSLNRSGERLTPDPLTLLTSPPVKLLDLVSYRCRCIPIVCMDPFNPRLLCASVLSCMLSTRIFSLSLLLSPPVLGCQSIPALSGLLPNTASMSLAICSLFPVGWGTDKRWRMS